MKGWRITLSHQVLALVAISILAAQVTGLIVLFSLPPRPAGGVAMSHVYDRTEELLRQVQAEPGGDLAKLARAASDRRLLFTVSPTPPRPLADTFAQRLQAMAAQRLALPPEKVMAVEFEAPPFQRFLRRAAPLPPPRFDQGQGADGAAASPAGEAGRFGGRQGPFSVMRGRRGLAVQVGGQWLEVRSPPMGDAPWLRQVALTFALTLAALMAPALWLAQRISAPIRAFADGAERFGINPNAPLLPAEGPYELRQATGAFNLMQNRIRRLVSDRTMMVGAVSHDLRTPLARIRFRINDLPPQVRGPISEDIDQMDEMIGQMLAFTREALPAGERRLFDLSALAHSLVDELTDAGSDVSFEGPERLVVQADMSAVRRILGNLLDNALKYAGHAKLRLDEAGGQILAIVEDNGPGVPIAMHQAVFEPFQRLEPSRNRKTGGVGLGLAIARNLARGHGGDVALDPTGGPGARFIFTLPTSAQAVAP
jgi:two-component system OmpR family sensor kinase